MTETSVYTTRDAFDIYSYYMALRKHFTSSYDFVKYGGKMRLSVDSFEKRRDKYFFYKLSKRKEAKEFVLANLIVKPDIWIGDLVSEEANKVYTEWSKRQQSLSYLFKNDLDELNDDFNSNFIVNDGQYPRLLQLFNAKNLSIETLIILGDMTGCWNHWDKKINDTIIYPSICMTAKKYAPFLSYDKGKMKSIVTEKFI
jgi:hypothetical protein|tara:strand:- start:1056 stop:1652 length:597 start_codon:yes stop_codon:yes gene_type:complete